MEERTHRWGSIAVCLAALLLAGVVARGGGSPSARARVIEGGSAAATPVAVPAAPVAPVVTLVIERADAAFGVVSGTGETDPSVARVTSSTDQSGAYYVKSDAIQLTVTSDGPWTGSCHARQNSGNADPGRVADDRLSWRLAGTETWTPFGTSPARGCFPERPAGTTTFRYDLRLRVERGDRPGAVAAAITFAVEPERSG